MVKINTLELENVKRIKAVKIQPDENGLTVIGGKNGQGKTSVLDSIAWALCGDRYRPSNAERVGSVIPPHLKVELSNGLIVERSGKNSSLKVIDPQGNRAGQQVLNGLIDELALNLPKFMSSSNKEKANVLLKIIGVGDELYKLEQEEQTVYNRRHTIGQIADQKKKHAKEMPIYPDAPTEFISAAQLINEQTAILAENAENQRKRDNFVEIQNKLCDVEKELTRLKEIREKLIKDLEIASMSVKDLEDRSTAELEKNIVQIDEINQKVRQNMDREKAELDAEDYAQQYNALTEELEGIRKAKFDLLNNANLPLPGLSVENGELTYNGFKWDNMSGSEQLKVATAIVRKLNPNCGFVLIDKLEQMDIETMKEFGEWLEQEGLQAIATRVSTGDECSIIIEDGYSHETEEKQQFKPRKWKEGEF